MVALLAQPTLVRRIETAVEYATPTVDTAYVLPSASGLIGKIFTVVNGGTANVLIQASNGSLVRTVYPATTGQVTPNTDAPTTAAQWEGIGLVTSNYANYVQNIVAVTTNPTKNPFAETAIWKRMGDSIFVTWAYRQTSIGTAGSGIYYFPLPNNLSIDYVKLLNLSGEGVPSPRGAWLGGGGAATVVAGQVLVAGATNGTAPNSVKLYSQPITNSNVSSNSYGFAQDNNLALGFSYELPVLGWSATKG